MKRCVLKSSIKVKTFLPFLSLAKTNLINMASDKLIFLVLFSLCIQNTFANRIRIIEVLTSDCEDCGMSAFGQLSIKVILGLVLF